MSGGSPEREGLEHVALLAGLQPDVDAGALLEPLDLAVQPGVALVEAEDRDGRPGQRERAAGAPSPDGAAGSTSSRRAEVGEASRPRRAQHDLERLALLVGQLAGEPGAGEGDQVGEGEPVDAGRAVGPDAHLDRRVGDRVRQLARAWIAQCSASSASGSAGIPASALASRDASASSVASSGSSPAARSAAGRQAAGLVGGGGVVGGPFGLGAAHDGEPGDEGDDGEHGAGDEQLAGPPSVRPLEARLTPVPLVLRGPLLARGGSRWRRGSVARRGAATWSGSRPTPPAGRAAARGAGSRASSPAADHSAAAPARRRCWRRSSRPSSTHVAEAVPRRQQRLVGQLDGRLAGRRVAVEGEQPVAPERLEHGVDGRVPEGGELAARDPACGRPRRRRRR